MFSFWRTPYLPFFKVIWLKYCPYLKRLIFINQVKMTSFVIWKEWRSSPTISLWKSHSKSENKQQGEVRRTMFLNLRFKFDFWFIFGSWKSSSLTMPLNTISHVFKIFKTYNKPPRSCEVMRWCAGTFSPADTW